MKLKLLPPVYLAEPVPFYRRGPLCDNSSVKSSGACFPGAARGDPHGCASRPLRGACREPSVPWMAHRRALEFPFIELQNIYFVGIRSFEPQELEFLEGREANIYTASALYNRGVRQVAEEICRKLSPLRHIYITLDIDFLDPAAAPGTGTPKPGGFTTREMLELLQIFARLPIIGMDVVEVSPPLDHADITSFAAQRAITEMWGHLFGS